MEDIEAFVAKLKVVELKDELKKRSLSTAGVKSVLAQRLQEAMIKQKDDEEEEAPMEEQAETADSEPEAGEEEAESKMEEESAETNEPMQQEEDEAAPPEDKAEETKEPSEPIPSQPEPVQTSEPSTDTPETTTPSTNTEPTPTEAVSAQTTGESTAEPTESTEQAATTSMDTPTQEANTEPAATEAPSDDKPTVQEEKSEAASDVASSQAKSGQESEEKMESTTSETAEAKNGPSQKQPETAPLGSKRSHDRVETPKTESSKSESSKPDPSKAPDPEEPESFDDSQILMENKFQPPEDDSVVTLDKYTSDLYFDIREDGLGGCGLTEQGFARLWASARGSIGVKGGRYYYQLKVEENISVQLPESEEHPHAIRLGWTVDETRKGLGEGRGSFAYGSTGKKVSNNKFDLYGEPFSPGDVIGCYLDFESSPATVFFSKNTTNLGSAFTLDESQSNKTYYPCITTKNVSFSINFGGSPAWCEVEGVEGFKFLQEASEDHRIKAPKGPSSASSCEVVMMVGLPASGKTTWAEKQCERYPGKRYTILGTNLIMERMKVSGLSRKENYRARFEALIKEATDILNKLFLLAAKNYRNYIIDQTNVYSGAQARKMKYFDGFFRKAEVVVPPHHELRRRTALRNEEMGGPLPDDAINAMKANFHIPKAGDVFDEVSYSDIYGVAAEKIVRQYREDALGLPSYPQSKRGRYDNYRSGGGGGSRYSSNRPGGQSGYSSHSYSSYSPRDHYGYEGGSYGYHHPRPRYSPYGNPAPPPPVYGNSPRGGGYGPPPYRSPYNNSNQGQYRGNYGAPPPPRRGYYGRY